MSSNFEVARQQMVREQLEGRGIANERVLDAMRTIPRDHFVGDRYDAYADRPIRLHKGQTTSQPYMIARMLELGDPEPTDRSLEIGAGSGYQTALLALLTEHVTSIERIASLASEARDRLDELELPTQIEVIVGDGTKGYQQSAPYDIIIVSAAADEIPPALVQQLADGGRLVIPAGSRLMHRLHRITRQGDELINEQFEACAFVPLVSGATDESTD